jgi:hypothetical protein
VDYRQFGYTGKLLEQAERQAAEAAVQRAQEIEAQRARDHASWLRLCGMMAPIIKPID